MSYTDRDSIKVSIIIPEENVNDIAPFGTVSSSCHVHPNITKGNIQISKSWYRSILKKFEPGEYDKFMVEVLKRVYEEEITILGVLNSDKFGHELLSENDKPAQQEWIIVKRHFKESLLGNPNYNLTKSAL